MKRLWLLAACGCLGATAFCAPPPQSAAPDNPGWIRFEFTRDIVPGSALDFSARLDAPAGRHGWLKAVGEHFEFEGRPGVPVRFRGINVCMNLTVVDHERADRLVERLAALGYNSIRLHHHDGRITGWSGDGSPPETGWSGDGRLDPEAMDRFDYLCARAIEKGLYLTTDLFVSRPVPWRAIGIDRDGLVGMDEFKALCLFHDGAFENWAAAAREFLLHVNPYTGRRYVDEPALPLVCTINEGWLVCGWSAVRKLPEIEAFYDDWRGRMVAEHGPDFMRRSLAKSAADANPWGERNAATALFFADVQEKGHRRQAAFLRDLGVKALLTAGNHGPNNAPNESFRIRLLDYADTHVYFDHPTHLNTDPALKWGLPSRCDGRNPIRDIDAFPLNRVAFARAAGKPFTLTEWALCGPGEYRSISGLYAGALASAQDWAGLWWFDYGHAAASANDEPGPFSVPDYFVLANDPVLQAAERIVANLFLRRDFPVLSPRLNLVVDDAALVRDGSGEGDAASCSVLPKRASSVWKARVSASLSALDNAENIPVSRWGIRAGCETSNLPVSEPIDPHVRLDAEAGSFLLDTVRTCGAFAPAGSWKAGPLAADLSGDMPVTVVATSLDGEPLRSSRRILLSHLTDCRGAGAVSRHDAEGRLVTESWGRDGILVRDAATRVSLALDEPERYRVWALAFSGLRRFEVPASAEDGTLRFDAAVRGADGNAVLEYEIEKE